MKNFIFIIFVLASLTSCRKKETPSATKHSYGYAKTSIDGRTYTDSLYLEDTTSGARLFLSFYNMKSYHLQNPITVIRMVLLGSKNVDFDPCYWQKDDTGNRKSTYYSGVDFDYYTKREWMSITEKPTNSIYHPINISQSIDILHYDKNKIVGSMTIKAYHINTMKEVIISCDFSISPYR